MMPREIIIHPAVTGCSSQVEPILRALPEWFGIEESLQEYVDAAGTMETILATEGDQAVGFLTIHRHFPESAEVHCMGVLPEYQGRGVGRRLMEACEAYLRDDGATVLQVKTIAEKKQDAAYLKSLAFYRRVGFVPLEVSDKLWQEWNPCLILVKSLAVTTP
jgi:GNAT superfamily N-acetyltransferase